jgi:hypothetical protein
MHYKKGLRWYFNYYLILLWLLNNIINCHGNVNKFVSIILYMKWIKKYHKNWIQLINFLINFGMSLLYLLIYFAFNYIQKLEMWLEVWKLSGIFEKELINILVLCLELTILNFVVFCSIKCLLFSSIFPLHQLFLFYFFLKIKIEKEHDEND